MLFDDLFIFVEILYEYRDTTRDNTVCIPFVLKIKRQFINFKLPTLIYSCFDPEQWLHILP